MSPSGADGAATQLPDAPIGDKGSRQVLSRDATYTYLSTLQSLEGLLC